MSGVFINYRGEDTHSYAALLYRELTGRFGEDLVFLDSESIEAGEDFADRILGQVRSAQVLLAVIGPRWLTAADPTTRRRIDDPRDWIRCELVVAFAAGVRVIPILTDDATLPTTDELPSDIAVLSGRQFLRLRHREASGDLNHILSDVTRFIPIPLDVKRGELARIADDLADSVAQRWQLEEERRKIQDPLPLPVRWATADEALMDHWANIRQLRTGDDAQPLELSGRLDEIADVYHRIPSGRLVVLGKAGSGKTVVGLRFVLDLLRSRTSGAAVPEIFSIGSWNPAVQPLTEWLENQLCRDHPGLTAIGPGGERFAAALVKRGSILPVLDGFDEIADGLHSAALRQLSATPLRLVLTSRSDEYADAVKGTRGLTRAAAIELNDLTLDGIEDYLLRSSPKAVVPDWDQLLAELHRNPDVPANLNVRTVLTTPLMVALARAVYSEGDTTRRDDAAYRPVTLLDTTRFSDAQHLEEHLLGIFLPSVYYPTGPSTWDPERAQRWLGYLAAHLNRLGTRDLAWWELGMSVPRWVRTLVLAVLCGYLLGVATAVGNLPVDLVATAHGLAFAIRRGLVVGTLHGVVAAVVFGLMYSIADRNDQIKPSPVRVRLPTAARPRTDTSVGTRIVYGLLAGAALGFAVLLIDRLLVPQLGLDDGVGGGLLSAIEFPAEVAFAAGLVFGIIGWLETPMDVRAAVSPADLLRSDRANVISNVAIWAIVFGVVVGIVTSFSAGPVRSIETGAVFALEGAFSAGLGYGLCLTAWGHWLALARFWLPLTGRLPWRLLAFLDDACDRGALRRTGAVYQFRHARLQFHLTSRPRPGNNHPDSTAA